jgi:DNA repair protein RadD
MNLRPYQQEAVDAINDHLMKRGDNPLCVIPTGGGKTVVFATLIQQWRQAWPQTRVCVLAHVKELLAQAEAKLLAVWPQAPVGVWSAGMKRREGSHPVLIAGIQSIYKRAYDFDPFDVLIVDEAHLIPVDGEGMYRSFIADCRRVNPNVRIVGFTATPYRLDGGHIASEEYILNHVAYEAEIARLIDEGFLCRLTSKATATRLRADGVKIRQGDYIARDLERAVNTDSLVRDACREMVEKGADRKSWLVFAAGIEHARHVAAELEHNGIDCGVVIGDTPSAERTRTLSAFDAGELRAVVNVGCLTTGLDVTRIDLIALLRPTQSTSLYIQMCGRGFRLHPGKADCLVLDFGENVLRHGPVDAVMVNDPQRGDGDGEAPSKVCPKCEEIVFAGVRECPACGYQFPPREIKHQRQAHEAPVLTPSEPWEMVVDDVEVRAHRKAEDKPPVLRVIYSNGMQSHSEWVCFEHQGFARNKAEMWWRRRFPGTPVPTTVEAALNHSMFMGATLADMTDRVKVKQVGRYTEVLDVKLKSKAAMTAGA